MLKRLVLALALLFVVMVILSNVRADESRGEESEACITLDLAMEKLEDANADNVFRLTPAQLDFARGLFSASPPEGPYPVADEGLMAMTGDGGAQVIFVAGKMSCGHMLLSPGMTQTMLNFDE